MVSFGKATRGKRVPSYFMLTIIIQELLRWDIDSSKMRNNAPGPGQYATI